MSDVRIMELAEQYRKTSVNVAWWEGFLLGAFLMFLAFAFVHAVFI